MSGVNLTYWLRKSPQPSAIVADEKRIEVQRNARSWLRELVATLESLDPSKITALDPQGNVIRSVDLDADGGDKSNASPEMSDLQLFAKLLADGYREGSKASQPIIDSAMGFVERQGQRLQKAEAEIERLRAHIHKLNLQIAQLSGAQPAGDDSLIGSLMAGAMAAAGGGGNPLAALTTAANGGKKNGGK